MPSHKDYPPSSDKMEFTEKEKTDFLAGLSVEHKCKFCNRYLTIQEKNLGCGRLCKWCHQDKIAAEENFNEEKTLHSLPVQLKVERIKKILEIISVDHKHRDLLFK